MNKVNIQLNDFDIIDSTPLYESDNSKVFLAKHRRKNDVKYIVKCYNSVVSWEKEKELLFIIKDGGGQKIRDCFLFPESFAENASAPILFTVFPKLGMNLKSYFLKKGTLNYEYVQELRAITAENVIPALTFLHESQIVHGDICPENILQGNRGANHWVLIDFGSSVYIDDYALPGKYMPPEYRNGPKKGVKPRATTAYDSFALGVMLVDVMMIFKERFWDTASKHRDFLNESVPIAIPAKIPAYGRLKRGIEGLLIKSPVERFRMEQFLPFLEYLPGISLSNLIERETKNGLPERKAAVAAQALKYIQDETPVAIYVPEETVSVKVSLGDLESAGRREERPKNGRKNGAPQTGISLFLSRFTTNFKIGVGIMFLVGISVIIVLVLTLNKQPSTSSTSSTSKAAYSQTSLGSGTKGFADGSIAQAKFNAPGGIALDSSSNLYLSDTGNNVIRRINSTLFVSTIAGNSNSTPSLLDGTGSFSLFNSPNGIAVSSKSGFLVVADVNNHAIRKIVITNDVAIVSTIGGNGASGFSNTGVGQFSSPYGVAIDSNDNIYVADTSNNAIRKISSGVVSIFANGQFKNPQGIAVDNSGNVFVADTGNGVIKKITAAGAVTTFFPQYSSSSSSRKKRDTSSLLSSPIGLAVDSGGNVYVVDNQTGVLFINASTNAISQFTDLAIKNGGGTAGIALSSNGSVYVADPASNNIQAAVSNTNTTVTSSSSTVSVVATTTVTISTSLSISSAMNSQSYTTPTLSDSSVVVTSIPLTSAVASDTGYLSVSTATTIRTTSTTSDSPASSTSTIAPSSSSTTTTLAASSSTSIALTLPITTTTTSSSSTATVNPTSSSISTTSASSSTTSTTSTAVSSAASVTSRTTSTTSITASTTVFVASTTTTTSAAVSSTVFVASTTTTTSTAASTTVFVASTTTTTSAAVSSTASVTTRTTSTTSTAASTTVLVASTTTTTSIAVTTTVLAASTTTTTILAVTTSASVSTTEAISSSSPTSTSPSSPTSSLYESTFVATTIYESSSTFAIDATTAYASTASSDPGSSSTISSDTATST